MKKLACILLVIGISVTTFASGHVMGIRYTASLDNNQILKSQKDEKRSLRGFSGRRYSSVTRGHGLHLFGRRGPGSGASRPESGLGL